MPNDKGMNTPSKVVLDKIKINLNEEDKMYLQFERPVVRGELLDTIHVLGTFPNIYKSLHYREKCLMYIYENIQKFYIICINTN